MTQVSLTNMLSAHFGNASGAVRNETVHQTRSHIASTQVLIPDTVPSLQSLKRSIISTKKRVSVTTSYVDAKLRNSQVHIFGTLLPASMTSN